MASQPTDDQITRLCQDLVYQVAYAFYDSPYILLLKLVVHLGVVKEQQLAEILHIPTPDVRKYLGMLHVHRLVKRHVNKEKLPIPEYLIKPGETERTKARDVIYWYMDYREFANVVKYRIAMMRKAIDAKISSEVGLRGYVCPLDGTSYAALDLAHLFDPVTNAFTCESCGTELVETDPGEGDGQDKMQRFNLATQPIRDALRAVEGVTLPSLNIIAWIAQNVRTEVAEVEREEAGKKFTVVLGGEEDREIIERERLAEQQRVQNALPVWHTHSTVTGSATSLGLEDARKAAAVEEERRRGSTSKAKESGDDLLAAHYSELDAPTTPLDPAVEYGVNLDDDEVMVKAESEVVVSVKGEPNVDGYDAYGDGMDALEDQEDEELERVAEPLAAAVSGAIRAEGAVGKASEGVMVIVSGVPKPLEDVTDEDQELMTPDEYQAYYEAALAALAA